MSVSAGVLLVGFDLSGLNADDKRVRVLLQEGLAVPDASKVQSGHKFVPQDVKRSSRYCERCNYIIWSSIQSWYQCECEFSWLRVLGRI